MRLENPLLIKCFFFNCILLTFNSVFNHLFVKINIILLVNYGYYFKFDC